MTGPRRDPHLGELAAAFADNELDLVSRDRALNHLAHCADCRADVDCQRRMRSMLRSLPPPPCPPDLLRSLRSLPEQTPGTTPGLPPVRIEAHFHPAPVPEPVSARVLPTGGRGLRGRPAGPVRPGTGGPTARRGPGRSPRRRLLVTAAGGAAAFALSLTGVVALGGDQPSPQRVRPPVTSFVSQHNQVTGGVPGNDRELGVLEVAETGR
jgi:hypothetical protein